MIAVRGGWAQKEHVAEKESVDSKLAVVRHSAGCSSTMRSKEGNLSEMHPESHSLEPKVMPHKQQSHTRPVTEMICLTDEKFAQRYGKLRLGQATTLGRTRQVWN